jgi:hypothetical protein
MNAKESFLSDEQLKMDPNYSWVLKDLNFGRKRMIDVTELLNSKEQQAAQQEETEKIVKSNNHKKSQIFSGFFVFKG